MFDYNPLTQIFMFYFYVPQSLKDRNLYFGYSDNLKRRVVEHEKGRVDSTSAHRPLLLVYYEAYQSEMDARVRERQIKRRANAYTSLRRRIQDCLVQ